MTRRTTRRELIGAAAAGAAFAAVPPAWAKQLLSTRGGIGPGSFDDGVASGEPSPTAITFWSRLTTARPRSGARLIVARDEGLSRVVATAVVPTGSGINGTLKARIGGLKPHSEYFYTWQSGNHVSPTGRSRTLPDPKSRQPLRLGYSSCQQYFSGYYSAHLHASTQDLDLYTFLGDYIYEVARAQTGTRPRADPIDATDLHSYRRKYALYRSDDGLRELHRLLPAVHIWDDHEVENDYTDNMPAPSPLQRAAAYRAAFEWLPRMVFPTDRYRIYKRIPFGVTADLFLLDERQYRTVDDQNRPVAILGEPQMEWLIAGLRASRAEWKILANQGVIAPNDYGQGQAHDNWGGYPADRARLLGALEQAGIPNVVFLTGDAHVFMVNMLANDTAPFRSDPSHRATAIEYVGGSVTSPGNDRTEADVQSRNPWVREYNGTLHGYAALTADASQLVTEYRASDLTTPAGATTTFERFTQPANANTVSRESFPPPAPPPQPPPEPGG
jgi:phosphodiesterase/alkaline phosphatase D-like protein